jgi:hypothetical protein
MARVQLKRKVRGGGGVGPIRSSSHPAHEERVDELEGVGDLDSGRLDENLQHARRVQTGAKRLHVIDEAVLDVEVEERSPLGDGELHAAPDIRIDRFDLS